MQPTGQPIDDDIAALTALLRWYADAGVSEAVADAPMDFFAAPDEPGLAPGAAIAGSTPRSMPARPSPPPPYERPAAAPVSVITPDTGPSADEAVAAAEKAAAAAQDFAALAAAVAAFDGCPLKKGARNTVFADGTPGADLLVIGEAPGRDEDRIGKPFVGRAGQLLDRMLAAIGRSRETDTLISNVIFWRPPGNRTPTQTETAMCRPFVDRLIALTEPKAIALAGGAPMQALLGQTGIMRARGRWTSIAVNGRDIPVLPMLHPAFLLRRPEQKRLAWADLLTLQETLMKG